MLIATVLVVVGIPFESYYRIDNKSCVSLIPSLPTYVYVDMR